MSDQGTAHIETIGNGGAPAPAPERRRRPRAIRVDESKRDKFVRLVDPRVQRALQAIRRIGKLGGINRYHYDYDAEDIEKITAVLKREVEAVEAQMRRPSRQLPLFSIEG